MKTEGFENGAEKSGVYCHFHHRVLGRFSMNDRRKRIKKHAFSNESELLWTGENKAKTLEWWKIFCSVFVETKTDTFKNALLWSEPKC